MEKKFAMLILCILACSLTAFGQQRLTGSVSGPDGSPIVGATVIEMGTSNGVVTDANGKFVLTVPSGAKLMVSFLGYVTQEITVGTDTVLDIKLAEDQQVMDEVVVVGYGVQKKADLTGSVAHVGGDKLSSVHATSISQALQGAMSGVQVTRTSGLPGAEATIRVRGVTTINDSDPLIIVDGIPGSLSMDVEDIESITVLKDAASASIYGARAASGVILVTTKRAKDGAVNIEYSGSAGFVRPTAFPQKTDYKTYMYMVNEVAWNDAGNVQGQYYPVYSKEFIDDYAAYNRADPNTYAIADWRQYMIKDYAPTTKHNLTVNYGNSAIQSKISVGYEKTDALYDHRSYTAITARMNNNLKINKWLSVSADASYRRGISENPVVNPLRGSYMYGPLWAPIWSDGRISAGRDGTNVYAQLHEGGFDNTWTDRLTAKLAVNITPLKGLVITGVYAPTVGITKGKTFSKKVPYYSANDPTLLAGYIGGQLETTLDEARNEGRTETIQLLVNYNKTFGKSHNLSLMGGYEEYYSFTETLGAGSTGLELTEYAYLDRANINSLSVGGTAYENAYQSFFARAGYDFKNRYLFQANVRVDSSSRFDKDYRTGVFPSFSGGWVVTEEPFIKNLNWKALSFLKFRVSWGTLGNERIGNYPYQATMNFSNALFVNNEGKVVSSMTAAQMEYNVKDITWETTKTWDYGVDAVFLNNRLSFNFDYYDKTTSDMLLKTQMPLFMGYNNPSRNAGTMRTKGWDVQVQWRETRGDFRYSVSANLSDYKSKMGSLSGTVFDGDQTTREGSYYNEWYGYRSAGLYLTQEQIDNNPKLMAVTLGDVQYIDVSGADGNPDGNVSADYDKVLLGNSLPRYIYGGNLSVGYKGFDLSVYFQGVGQQKNRMTASMAFQEAAWHNFPSFIVGKYYSHYNTAEQNARAKYPRLSTVGYTGNNYVMSDFWLIDGSYFRLKNITLSYTLPKKLVNKLSLENVKVYASVSDLFTLNRYPRGWDPEMNTNGSSYIAQTYNFGLVIKL